MEESKDFLSIKSWAEEDQPREKLLLKGKAALSDAELITILLRTGVTGSSALDIAKKIINHVNGDLNYNRANQTYKFFQTKRTNSPFRTSWQFVVEG